MVEDATKFGRWYEKNKGKLALRRKKRYRNDPKYRAKAVKHSRGYRASFPNRKAGDPHIINVGGLPRTCWRIGQVSKKLGCPETLFRTWERRKMIPGCTVDSKIRTYTAEQVVLMASLWEAVQGFRQSEKGIDKEMAKVIVEAASRTAIKKWRK